MDRQAHFLATFLLTVAVAIFVLMLATLSGIGTLLSGIAAIVILKMLFSAISRSKDHQS